MPVVEGNVKSEKLPTYPGIRDQGIQTEVLKRLRQQRGKDLEEDGIERNGVREDDRLPVVPGQLIAHADERKTPGAVAVGYPAQIVLSQVIRPAQKEVHVGRVQDRGSVQPEKCCGGKNDHNQIIQVCLPFSHEQHPHLKQSVNEMTAP